MLGAPITAVLAGVALLGANESCSGKLAATVCTPGTTQECLGPGRCPGAQACDSSGSAWGPCECGVVADANAPDTNTATNVQDATLADDTTVGAASDGAVGVTEGGPEAAAAADATSDAVDAIANDSSSGSADGSLNGDARAPRCDDAGVCNCFNIASLGYGGSTGAQSGQGGTDNTEAFVEYLNTQSNALALQIGCGADTGCNSPQKPTLTAAFLAQYDVLLFQWMANSLAPVIYMGNPSGYTGDPALGGGGYWTFSSDELAALKTWVQGGGGVIVLAGYDFCPSALTNSGCTSGSAGELGPTNQIVQALTDMSFTATNTFGVTEVGNAEYCLGDSNPVTGWANDALGMDITEVGAFHGRGIIAGSTGVVDCNNLTFGTCAAHEDVGKGHVYIYTDEWVTYTSQWNPNPQPATYCSLDGSTANGDFPAVQVAYQVPQFWFNAIGYASQATACGFSLQGTP